MALDYKTFFLLAFCAFMAFACSSPKKTSTLKENVEITNPIISIDSSKTDTLLENLLKLHPQYFDSILKNRKDLNVQIIYTQIDRNTAGAPSLTNYYFNVNANKYYYPASTVKLPIALLALQRLNELKKLGIDKNTTLQTEAVNSNIEGVYNDATSPDGRPTIEHYIKKILMVSDNDAYNRLYEFLGQEYINKELHIKGYTNAQILHRLEIFLTEQENRTTNPINFLDSNSNVIYHQNIQINKQTYTTRNDKLGKGYYKNGQLINEPMDFSKKNRLGLEDLHNIIMNIVFPQKTTPNNNFNLTEEDRMFVLKYMSQLPTESIFPPYSDEKESYWPAYCKFLLLGSEKIEWPQNIRMFNKVGDAYGQMIDAAYIVDYEKGIEFFLSAAIYCNSDGILNDNNYDYDTIGFPFMKNLGQVIYDYEVKREKKFKPNLEGFKFIYDNENNIK